MPRGMYTIQNLNFVPIPITHPESLEIAHLLVKRVLLAHGCPDISVDDICPLDSSKWLMGNADLGDSNRLKMAQVGMVWGMIVNTFVNLQRAKQIICVFLSHVTHLTLAYARVAWSGSYPLGQTATNSNGIRVANLSHEFTMLLPSPT